MGADTRYIVVRRSDIPNGTLQVLDLWPNTSQRNLVYDPPGQTKYYNRFDNDTVLTVAGGGGAILTRTSTKGLASYLIDHVEAGGIGGGGGPAFTAAEAASAAAAIVAIADAGTAMTITTVNAALAGIVASTELVATTSNSTGDLEELLRILAGAEYTLPAGVTVDDDGSTFTTAVGGSFDATKEREIFATSAFLLSKAEGELYKLMSATYSYNGTAGAALAVYNNTGAVVT